MSIWLVVCCIGVGAGLAGWWFGRYSARRAAAAASADLLFDPRHLELAEQVAAFGVWEADLVSRSILLSPGAAALSGYGTRTATTASIEDLLALIHPDDQDAANASAQDAIQRAGSFQVEFRVRQADSTFRWRRNRGQVEMENGRPLRMVGALSDIHEEKVMLERLAEAAARISLAEDVAGFGVWELDAATGIMTLSAGAATLSGFEHQNMQVPAEQVGARIHPADGAAVAAAVDRALRHGEPYRLDCRVRLPDGGLRWIRIQAQVEMRDGKAVRITGAIIDTTRERILLDQLQQSAERLRLAEAAAGFGVWESDLLSHTVTVSEGIRRLHELPEDAPLTCSVHQLVGMLDPDYVALVKAATDASIETGQPCQFEVPMRLRDGTTRWRRIQARPEYVNGKPRRLVGATLDITHERQMRLSLEQARLKAEAAAKAKSEFLANMSHEIRTPLNGVIGMTQLLLDSPLTSQQRDWADTAMSSGTALLSIINDILDFSKIEAGKLKIDVVSFDLRRLLEEVAGILASKAVEKGIDLIVRHTPGTPEHLIGDADRIRQVVLNMANNAIKFTNSGYVLITADAVDQDTEGATIRVAVTDTGIGIAPHLIETLFDKFTQADSSTTRRYGGTGLGLAISKRLVELMRGTIEVNSEEGRGSTFAFTLHMPLGNVPGAEETTPAALLRGARVLIAVNNVVSRRVIHEQVTSFGMRSGSCLAGQEAVECLRAAKSGGDPYQIVIADHDGVSMDGAELAAHLRRDPACCDVVFVMLTSISQTIDDVRLAQMGIDACLVKPVRHARLISTLVAASERRRGRAPMGTEVPTAAATESISASGQGSSVPQSTIVVDAALRGAHVLVVEDNLVNQKVAVALLNKLGVRADVAKHGGEAVERVRAGSYDLVLMDCQMPIMNGYDATVEIRRQGPAGRSIPIIAMTADVIDGSRERAFEAGMNDFVAKPVGVHELTRALQTWLKKAA